MSVLYDIRFDEKLLGSLVHQVFHKFRCDPYSGVPKVCETVGFYIGDHIYKLSNIQEKLDYDKAEEMIAVNRFALADESEIVSALENGDCMFVGQ